jgi:hypothetical protein
MGDRRISVAVVVGVLLAVAGACAPVGGGTGTTTTTAPTTGPGRGHVAGATLNQVCGGPIRVPPAPCTEPFRPASDLVTVSRGDVVVAQLQSSAAGTFALDLPASTYTFVATPNRTVIPLGSVSLSTTCPAVKAEVIAGTTTSITLRCSIGVQGPLVPIGLDAT